MPAKSSGDLSLEEGSFTAESIPSITHTNGCHKDVVISGISCRLPESNNMDEFRLNLMDGIDMVTEDDRRWEPGLHGLPRRNGKLKDISKFDASFFGVHPKQANCMDPQLRLLLEVTYEAIVDAGVDPSSIRGSKTGVFIGASASESHEAWSGDVDKVVGYTMTGCTRSMFANRLSYFFDFKGPSYTIDTACSSSLLALDQALHSIREGHCDAAIVGGSNLCLKPTTALQFQNLGMLSPDGTCKSFDEEGNGYCRSEGVVSIYIQKSTDAKRVYATVIHSKTNSDGNKEQGITFPSGTIQKQLFLEVYSECCVDPSSVAYVEAHGTGTRAGDPQEVNTITDVFCKGRQAPLLIGSVKSNMGHSEPASGLAAVAKVLIAMEDGILPGNLHYNNPNPDIPGLTDGKLSVVTKQTTWNAGIVGVNSFGFGGSNVHTVLKSNPDGNKSNHSAAKSKRLLVYSSRTQEGLQNIFNSAKNQSQDIEFHALLNETGKVKLTSHRYKGYSVINGSDTCQEIQYCDDDNRPVWYVFAGMGTQWHGMGRQMMELDIFKQSILKSDKLLRPHGVHLHDLLTQADESSFDDTVNSFVGIAAIQVALVDILTCMGIKPDGIVGHSVGELGCGYADGSLTAEETVLAAYHRGRCIKEAKLPPGGMAAVGLTWEEAKELCPPGVVPACHNAEDTVTVSGPAESVAKFVEDLKTKQIFAKEVKTSGVAFHSYYMADIAPELQSALSGVIVPKLRSKRWISSSVPENEWTNQMSKFSSADYHVNNLVSPVLFQEALKHVPDNAIVIEIAPHSLLQAILKRSLSGNCCIVGLNKRGHADNLEYFFSSLGKCYMNGLSFDPLKLYSSVSFPVSRGTPMISPLIKWDHSINWDVPKLEQFTPGGLESGSTFEIDTSPDSPDNYLIGHTIDGRVLYPATGYLILVWKALAKMRGQLYEQVPVIFENVHIHRATLMPSEGKVKFEVSLMKGTGEFEIREGGAVSVTGRVGVPNEPFTSFRENDDKAVKYELTSSDIYKELRLRGYDYGPDFRGILRTNIKGKEGELLWNGNWVSYIDTMLQVSVLGLPGKSLRLPTRIQSLLIDPNEHTSFIYDTPDDFTVTKVIVDRDTDTCIAGGVKILGLHAAVAPRRQNQQAPPVIEEFHFVPYLQSTPVEYSDYLKDYSQSCCSLVINKLKNKSEQNETVVEEYLKEYLSNMSNDTAVETLHQESYLSGLFGVLSEILDLPVEADLEENIQHILQDNKQILLEDLLLNYLSKPEILKPCLDIVMENIGSTHLKIVELEASSNAMYKYVIPYFTTHPTMQLDYTTADGCHDNIEEEESFDLSHIRWNIRDSVPANLKSNHLVVAKNVLHKQSNISQALKNISDAVSENGFILVQEVTRNFLLSYCMECYGKKSQEFEDCEVRTFNCYLNEEKWRDLFNKEGYEVVYMRSDGLLSTLFLLQKKHKLDLESQTLLFVDDLGCDWVSELKNQMLDCQSKPEGHNLWISSVTSANNGIVGLVNCLRQEPGGKRIRCIFNTSLNSDGTSIQKLTKDSAEFIELVQKDLVMNIYRDNTWGSFRHIPVKDESRSHIKLCERAYVNVLTKGDLSSLQWVESPLKYHSVTQTSKQLCNVHYAALNFRDIMLATGKLPPDAIPGNLALQDCILGMEFAGKDETGRRVMGLLPAKGLATVVDVNNHFLWKVPDDWTLEQAATVPVVYSTVYYALVVRGQIREGDKVLIHSGSGGVGQAAISVALHYGCEVFTTVGSREKKEYLQSLYPQIDDVHISNSRNTTFESDILKATKGKGVDVVLNSLAEEKLQASLRVLSQHGRFLEIGKLDLSNNTPLGMSIFLKNISFHGILLDALFEDENRDWERVSELLCEGIKSGAVRPLKTTVFDKDQLEDAFRFMAQGKHIGKVLVKIKDETETQVPVTVSAIQKTVCHPDKVFIITGGLGGFGLELAQWLIECGATKLVLTSRSGVRTGYQARKLLQWKKQNIQVTVSTADIKTVDGAKSLIVESMKYGNIGGLFHLAMVLKDGFIENQTKENFLQVCEPKVHGTINLDQATREFCKESLDWFVVFSSVSCGRGNAGQANYGFANSVMERVCEQRKHDHLPGLAIQWGAIGDVGVVIDTMGTNETVIGGTLPQRMTSCLSTLDQFLNQSHPVVSSFVPATKEVKQESSKCDLVASVCNILGIKDPSLVNTDMSLGDLGLDSLMGVEVKQTLERDFDLNLSMKEIRMLSLARLKEISTATSSDNSQKRNEKIAENDSLSSVVSEDSGISARYDMDQIVPMEAIVLMNDVQNDKLPLFLVHPLEGGVTSLRHLTSHIDTRVYGLQCTGNAPLDSIESLAKFYIQQIKTVQPEGPYHIAGYSFGSCVAIEMVLELQRTHSDEAVNSLHLLDGSHKFVAAHTQTYRHTKTITSDKEAETEALCAFVQQFTTVDYIQFSQDLLLENDLNGRLHKVVKKLAHTGLFKQTDELELAASSFYRKLVIAEKYKPQGVITGDISLIKAEKSDISSGAMEKDYGLSEVCSGNIHTYIVEGDHNSFIQGDNAKTVVKALQLS